MSAVDLIATARARKRELLVEPLAALDDGDMDLLKALEARWKRASDPLTARAAMELIAHEAIVQEAYKDSVGVWTWSVGITNASGHTVYPRYKDNPQSLRRCLEVFLWALREKYIPGVLKAFEGHPLAEHEFAAALSFHYNTGAIGKADWVRLWKAGSIDAARGSFMNWRKPLEIIPRRTKERDLFFDGTWTADGKATVFPVKKPSYTPDFRRGQKVDVLPILKELLA